ncbi:amino acid permease [uncultured Desulfosarcina sp.]|uniref:APC family permease n=1 Tax=uncultured Desulfosarcina sp. TaxID=218289 RepID=UPI0029C982D3|nr:amino acid permease [uncultured Desulfosarcina sp.]
MTNDSSKGNGLKRELGLFSATVLVIANMVGTGIFTTSGFIMAELGDPRALLLCWLFGGLFALCGALCYGELGARFPRAGGEYVFLKESLGKPVGFLSGWISLIVGFSAPIAAASVAFATYFFQTFSIPMEHDIAFSISGVRMATLSPLTLTAIGVILLFSLLHYHSLRIGSRVQNGLTLFKVTLVVVFIGAGFWVGNGSVDHFSATASIPWSAEKFAVALIFVSFAYSGWNAAAYLGAEITAPQRNIPLSLFAGTVVVMILYLLLNLIYLYALPPEAMQGVMEIGAKSAASLFGFNMGRLFSGAVALGLLSVLSAMMMTGPRVYYAMSKDRIFFDVFGRLDTVRKTPAASIFLQAGIAIVMVVSASFETLLLYIGFTLSLFAMLTVIGLMRTRRFSSSVAHSYKTFAYPLTPLVFILGNLWIIIFSIKSRPITALFGLGTIGMGIAAYVFFDRLQRPKNSAILAMDGVNAED